MNCAQNRGNRFTSVCFGQQTVCSMCSSRSRDCSGPTLNTKNYNNLNAVYLHKITNRCTLDTSVLVFKPTAILESKCFCNFSLYFLYHYFLIEPKQREPEQWRVFHAWMDLFKNKTTAKQNLDHKWAGKKTRLRVKLWRIFVSLPRMTTQVYTATWPVYPRLCFLGLGGRRFSTSGGKLSTCKFDWHQTWIVLTLSEVEFSCEEFRTFCCHVLLLSRRQLFTEVYLVTNADKWVAEPSGCWSGLTACACCCKSFTSPLIRYKHYERWATANDFPVENIVNDGSTTLKDQLGAVADLELVIRSRKLDDDVVVVRGGQNVGHSGSTAMYIQPFLSLCLSRLLETCCVLIRTLISLKLSASSGPRWAPVKWLDIRIIMLLWYHHNDIIHNLKIVKFEICNSSTAPVREMSYTQRSVL